MTIIACTHGLVLTDLRRGINYNTDTSDLTTSKVIHFPKPRKIRSKTFKVNDWFFACSGTGSEDNMHETAIMLGVDEGFTLDLAIASYRRVDDIKMLNEHNSFRMFFFGLKGVMTLMVESGNVTASYARYMDKESFVLGSGAAAWNVLESLYGLETCPVKRLLASFAMEPTCGGGYEVWRLPTAVRGPGSKLIKLKKVTELSLKDSFAALAQPNKITFKEESKQWLASYIKNSQRKSASSSKSKTSTSSPPKQESTLKTSKRSKKEPNSPRSKKSGTSPKPAV